MSKPIIDIHSLMYKYFIRELDINKCKLPELKEISRYYKLRITGSKPVLLERLTKFFKENRCATIIQSVFRGHLVRFSIKVRGIALKQRNMCVNDSDFYTLDPISEIDHNDFYSYKDNQGFIYGFSVSSLIALFKRKGNITNPYNREKMDFKTMNEIFILYKLNHIIYENPSKIHTVENAHVNTDSSQTNRFNAQTSIQSNNTSQIILNHQQELSQRINEIQSRPTPDRIRELFMEMDQLGNYTQSIWFSSLTERGLIQLYRYLYEVWTYRGQLTLQTKQRICSLRDPFNNSHTITTVTIEELQKKCLQVMEYMVYTGIDVEYQKIGTLHVLSCLTLVSIPARQSMYWLYEGLLF